MALMNCPECNKEISDTVRTCPNCGYKIKRQNHFFSLLTQTSHIKNGICSLKNQYFSSQNSAQAAAEPHSNAFCMYFGSR